MLKTQIGDFHFDNCLMNASGLICKTKEELEALNDSEAGTFVTKTATLEAREGNERPREMSFDLGSINSAGLPNLGIDYYLEALDDIQTQNPRKNYFLSVSELAPDKIIELLEIVNQSDFQGLVELNLSCPNIIGKPLVAYDFETVDWILNQAFAFFKKPLGVKLAPYFDTVHFDQVADILRQYPLAFVTTINTIGNALVIDDESTIIKGKEGMGGLGGPVVKATALANVHAFYKRLGPAIPIIGVGGVTSGRDAFEHILCGASMVQVGTALYPDGPKNFARISQELRDIMEEKGYKSLEDFRGKLQYI